MLIDGGGYTDNRYFDVGARVVAPVLRYRKVMQVDVLVLSHPSSDHMNGLVYVMGHFHPQKLIWTGDRASTESFRRFSHEVARSGVAVPPWHAIERRMIIGGVVVDILHPPMETKAGLPLSGEALNNRSLVLKLTMDQSAILFTGDIEARTEAALIACCRPQLSSQVLVAPHHGSQTSSTNNFIDAIDPTLVLFSVGWRNRFGFPHAAVMERYRVRGSRLYRTDEHGALHLKTGGHQWTIETRLE
jgi:competence protein ComEC